MSGCAPFSVSPVPVITTGARRPRTGPPDACLAARIRVVHRESDGTYGVPRITAEHREEGRRVNHERIARVMRSIDLAGVRRLFVLGAVTLWAKGAAFPSGAALSGCACTGREAIARPEVRDGGVDGVCLGLRQSCMALGAGARVTLTAHGHALEITVRGEVDGHGSDLLDAAWAEAAEAALPVTVIDLSGVSFGDSALLNLLMRAQRHHDGAGRRLVLLGPLQRQVVRLLTALGTMDGFTVTDSRSAALADDS
ncbi:IS3 family transposase [Streptomyces sp. NPDC046977]|uniref:STAS domain-containing protein n=1 Tax=Streptomyces sp. NPDC046977 TaxID=3154703 RepID=UPI0033D45D50